VSSRASKIVLLCEDDAHSRLALAYMKHCGIRTDYAVDPQVASRLKHGGNVGWVLDQFPRQLHACRQRHKARANTQLIVLVDADTFDVDERRRHLDERLTQAGYDKLAADDPVVLLIPRRHVETWIRSLLGDQVSEEDDCKGWKTPTRDEIRQAAQVVYGWARDHPKPGPTCVPSLQAALPGWRKIG
jgi:hypothetical protein